MRNELWIHEVVMKFLQLSFPEFEVNVFAEILTIWRFSIWPDTEKYSLLITHEGMPI